MSLNPSSCASALDGHLTAAYDNWPSKTFPSSFASDYKAYSQAGTLSGNGGLSGSEDESILSNFLNSFPSSTSPDNFATALSNYWATCKLVMGAGVISIVNNAASKQSAFKSAVEASITDTESTPHFLAFITNIENVAKTIEWTVTRAGSPPTVTIETIS